MRSSVVTVTIGPRPPPISPVSDSLIFAGSTWKYWDSATAPGAGWQQAYFDDSAWPAGPARFGWGLDGEVTTLTAGRTTHYFRRWFSLDNPALLTELIFELVRDDGAVVYLNGIEVLRSNMPAGPVTATTLALATVNSG